jgi:Anti-sigma-K factor rskA
MADQNHSIQWLLAGGLGMLTFAFIAGSWYAGHSSSSLEVQRLRRQSASLQDQLASARMDRVRPIPAPASGDAADLLKTRADLQRCEAESNQYRSKLETQFTAAANDRLLSTAMLAPKSRLYSLQALEADSNASGYIVAVPHSRLVLLASHLPDPGHDRQFQLWSLAKDGSPPESAGLLPNGEEDSLVFEIEDPSIGEEPITFAISEEPLGGSNQPTGPKVLVSPD